MKFKFLKLDERNCNGRIYPKETVQKAIDKFMSEENDGKRFVTKSPGRYAVELENVFATVEDMKIEDDWAYAEIKPLNLNHLDVDFIMDQLNEGNIHLVPKGQATLDKDGMIGEDYKILSLDTTADPSYSRD